MVKEGKENHLTYVKESLKEYIRSYMTDAKWTREGYIPTMEEHISVSFISSGYKFIIISRFVGMDDITVEPFEWAIGYPPLSKACCTACRIMDDIVSHKEEQERKHVASGIECYMNQFGVSEEYVYALFTNKVETAWKEMNHESLMCKDISMPLKMQVINLARVHDVMYKYQDNFIHVGEELVAHIKSLLVNTMSV